MKRIKISALVAAAVLSTGCSSWFEEQKQDVKVNNRQTGLVVPQGLNNPIKSEEFKIVGATGESSNDVVSPTTVLVILEGSWVNEDDNHPAKIMVEKPSLVKDFPAFINKGIKSYADYNDVKLEKTATGYTMSKTYQEETGFWFWTSMEDVETFEYQLTVDMKEHGRSGQVYVEPINFTVINEELAPELSKEQRVETLAVQTLNDIMLEIDYLYRVELKKERSSIDLSLKLVKNIAGNYVISSQQDIKYVWSQIEDIIEELGFDIVEEDETLFVYETEFSKSGDSSWNPFDSGISNRLNIEEGEYEVTLSTSTTGVDISIRQKGGDHLDQAQMENVFELFFEVAKEEEAEL